MLVPTTLDELQVGDEVVVRYYAEPGGPGSAVQCRGLLTAHGTTMFGAAKVEYVKVGLTPVLVGVIIEIERVVAEGEGATSAGGEKVYCCNFNGLTELQIGVLGEFSEVVTKGPRTTTFIVRGFYGIEFLRDAAKRLGLGEPVFSRWSRQP